MSGPRHLSPRSRVCAQEWHSKDIHSHIYCQTPMHSPHLFISLKKKNAKRSTHETWCFRLQVLFLSSVLVVNDQEAWHLLLRTAPRDLLALGQYWQKTFVDVFNTYSNIFRQQCPTTAPQADSWWLGHVEPADVVISDIAGQALDIFLHGPESAHKNGIVKTFTHTSIPKHPCTLLKNKTIAKRSTHQTWCFCLLVLVLSSVLVSDGQEAWQMLLRTAPRRRPCRLTDNICTDRQHL